MVKIGNGVVFLFVFALLIVCVGFAHADRGVNATPEIQQLLTSTSSDVVGTVTESDAGTWNLNGGPWALPSPDDPVWIAANAPFGAYQAMLTAWQIWQTGDIPAGYDTSWTSFWTYWRQSPRAESQIYNNALTMSQYPSTHYTVGYNDQYSGVSGKQTFAKELTVSTGNTIADQNNLNANSNIQYLAVDTGRATRTENLLLDGSTSQSTDAMNSILCPFTYQGLSVIPAYCNIVEAGSSMDTTLTSAVTSADTRFVGTDPTVPVTLNYNINAEGINIGNQSSPMIGSVSSYLKVHVQEARNFTTNKSEDLAYSETSSASGLVNHFSKSISYTSQASSVPIGLGFND